MTPAELSTKLAALAEEAREDCPEVAACLFALAGTAVAEKYWQARMLSAVTGEARLFIAAAEESCKMLNGTLNGDGRPN